VSALSVFEGWSGPLAVLVSGVIAYAGLLLFIRVSGKRTLSKMNAFDLVVTVALGSTLATILLNRNVSLAEGLTALATLILLQYLVAWLQVRSGLVRRLAKSEPRLLYYHGRFLDAAMRHERAVRAELLQAVRSTGHQSLESVEAVVLETDGTFAVVTKQQGPDTAMADVDIGATGLRGGPGRAEGGRTT
jgi:uncharacterized membrane protein YcaP (DUF421 family)